MGAGTLKVLGILKGLLKKSLEPPEARSLFKVLFVNSYQNCRSTSTGMWVRSDSKAASMIFMSTIIW